MSNEEKQRRMMELTAQYAHKTHEELHRVIDTAKVPSIIKKIVSALCSAVTMNMAESIAVMSEAAKKDPMLAIDGIENLMDKASVLTVKAIRTLLTHFESFNAQCAKLSKQSDDGKIGGNIIPFKLPESDRWNPNGLN